MKVKAICQSANVESNGECSYSFHQAVDTPEKWKPFIVIKDKASSYVVGQEYTLNLEVTKAEK